MKKYFTHNGVKEEGPFTLSELSTKGIKADTPIWFDGLSNWTVAALIPELETLLAPKSTPPPFKQQQKAATPAPKQQKVSTPVSKREKVAPAKNNPEEDNKEEKSNMKIYVWVLVVTLAFFLFTITVTDDARLPAMSQEATPEDTNSPAKTPEQEEEQALENDKMVLRNDWSSHISAKPNEYEVDKLGGISLLEVRVTNSMAYPLDEVKVEVKYIKENGDVFETEYVKIKNVPANGKASMPAPDSNRGTSVQLKIVAVQSTALNFCYNAEVEYTSAEDPYLCK
ncbi:DUF4339 domain-containing protein [Desertivirga brevis]|uniref:DUF4339 domain-containing protein n=1 Tax=Desertivirga brevis TaxID=2810310 RepID=UPI001A96DD9F|nr:DUF4339 domain-containing protein [Pedobacter sp. SYSU D00873]